VRELLVVYHSQSGSTARLAREVFEGASTEPQCKTRLLPALEAGVPDLRRAQGVVFCTPENFGYMSGGMKDFLDRTFYPLQGGQQSWSCAILVSAGNDGSGAVRAIERIATGYGWNAVAAPLVAIGEQTEAQLAQAREIGQLMAAGLSCGIF